MAKDAQIKVSPWCPFCGQDVGRPREPVQRKLDEFTMGECQCGATYTCDPTGFNVGAAMVEAIVHACDDNWDLAWELLPDEDYLTGRIDNYDEQTHQVYETKNVDGRKVAGVLYFVRLNRELAALAKRLHTDKNAKDSTLLEEDPANDLPAMESARDPKRKKKRADKTTVTQMAKTQDIDGLVDLAFDDLKTLRFIQRLLYDPDESNRWQYAHVLGQVCRRLSTRKPGAVSDLLHRLFEACSDSAAAHWGLLESIGSIIAARADIYGGFARHLLMHRGVPTTRVQVLWALGTIAEKRPDIVRATPFYSLFPFVTHSEPITRGHAVRLLGRIAATEVESEIEKLTGDEAELTIYEQGQPVRTTVAELAREALAHLHRSKEPKND
ncbi:MAG: HEAT repeat domain-containing protein [Desulfobulbaceae bacterium]|nr:HEAT repeat domain-containing protein [Desulfobulbaceae bacterium]HIJ90220.1 HEAT repeat domain-containing protein [Deltaproteobacteria bacterium]